MRICYLCGHVQFKFMVIIDLLIANADHSAAFNINNLLLDNGIDGRLQLLVNFLEKNRVPAADRYLENFHESIRRQPNNLQLLRFVLLNPLVRLHLRVDHKRPAIIID